SRRGIGGCASRRAKARARFTARSHLRPFPAGRVPKPPRTGQDDREPHLGPPTRFTPNNDRRNPPYGRRQPPNATNFVVAGPRWGSLSSRPLHEGQDQRSERKNARTSAASASGSSSAAKWPPAAIAVQ